jgi:hypothetical protein
LCIWTEELTTKSTKVHEAHEEVVPYSDSGFVFFVPLRVLCGE